MKIAGQCFGFEAFTCLLKDGFTSVLNSYIRKMQKALFKRLYKLEKVSYYGVAFQKHKSNDGLISFQHPPLSQSGGFYLIHSGNVW